jgi:hypothetical protein
MMNNSASLMMRSWIARMMEVASMENGVVNVLPGLATAIGTLVKACS